MNSQPDQRRGAGGYCICARCNEKIPHRAGIPCREETCPACGGPMVIEGSHHHQLLKRKRESEKSG